VTQFRVEIRRNEAAALLQGVPRALEQAAARALNGMNPLIKQAAGAQISGLYNMSQKYAERHVRLVSRAGPNRLMAIWAPSGKPEPLKAYKPRVAGAGGKELKPRKKRGGKGPSPNNPVSVEVFRGRRRTLAQGFLGPNGHVYARIGKARNPIRKLFGPGVPSGFIKSATGEALKSVTKAKFASRLEAEIVRQVAKIQTGRLPKAIL